MLEDLDAIKNPLWIVHSLENGLLPTMLRSTKWIDVAQRCTQILKEPIAATLMSRTLTMHLVFPRVVRSMRMALKQVERLGLATRAAAGPLYESLTALKETTEERSRLLAAWRNDDKYKHLSSGDDVCQSVSDSGSFLRSRSR